MKLLGWMHRKLRQTGSPADPFKDFAMERTSRDDNFGAKTSFSKSSTTFRPSNCALRKSFTSLLSDNNEDDDPEAEDELFRGLLAIGTLGSDPTMEDLPTEMQEREVDELKKVEGTEPTSDGSDGGVKDIQARISNGNSQAVCPLQGYLLGSSVEIAATSATKKERRASLGELFMKEEGRKEEKKDGGGDRASVNLVKKILKRRVTHGSSRGSPNSDGGGGSGCGSDATIADTISAETKLQKILHLFHRKVHPESCLAIKQCDKPRKNGTKKRNGYSFGVDDENGDQLLEDDHHITIQPTGRPTRKERNLQYAYDSNPSLFELCSSGSNGNREYWIKTDADYLVLEL